MHIFWRLRMKKQLMVSNKNEVKQYKRSIYILIDLSNGKMYSYTDLSLVISIVWRHFLLDTISCFMNELCEWINPCKTWNTYLSWTWIFLQNSHFHPSAVQLKQIFAKSSKTRMVFSYDYKKFYLNVKLNRQINKDIIK